MALVLAVHVVCERRKARNAVEQGASANEVASECGHHLKGPRRHGNGAVKGSWSGTMSPAPRFAAVLRRLAREGLIEEDSDRENYRAVFYPKGER